MVARELLDAAIVDARRRLAKAATVGSRRRRDKLFAESLEAFTEDVAGYFRGMAARILPVEKAQAIDWDPDADIDWQAEEAALREVLGSWYLVFAEAAYDAAGAELGVSVAWNATAPGARAILARLAAEIREITNVSRAEVRRLLEMALERGYTLEQLVRGVADDGFAGLAEMVEQWASTAEGTGESRAMLIARTETATAYNESAVAAYEDSGVVDRVEVFDGESDAECAAANGQIWTLEQARANPIAHPNCVRAFGPVASA